MNIRQVMVEIFIAICDNYYFKINLKILYLCVLHRYVRIFLLDA